MRGSADRWLVAWPGPPGHADSSRLETPLPLQATQREFHHGIVRLDAAQQGGSVFAIGAHLRHERLWGGKFLVGTKEAQQFDVDGLSVDVALKIENVNFKEATAGSKGGTAADITYAKVPLAFYSQPHGVDALHGLHPGIEGEI